MDGVRGVCLRSNNGEGVCILLEILQTETMG